MLNAVMIGPFTPPPTAQDLLTHVPAAVPQPLQVKLAAAADRALQAKLTATGTGSVILRPTTPCPPPPVPWALKS